MARTIDLNCDMGEGFGAWSLGEDETMLSLVSSANIACGFHAGDPAIMRATIRLARARGVSVGAHPGFADLRGFGRRRMVEDPGDLEAQLIYQIAACAGLAAAEGHAMTHVKMHGALYTMAASDAGLAEVCARAVRAVDPRLVHVCAPFSQSLAASERAGLRSVVEVFADRSYGAQGTLTPRGEPGALILDVTRSLDQVLEMVVEGRIPTTAGGHLPVDAATICVHGDTPGAPALARALREGLERHGIAVVPFACP